jgi:murein DD-endopeptidase MepM/ murein hydrolase activator NlpD
MGYMLRRSPIWILLAVALLAATAARAVTKTSDAGASASAVAITISVPGQGVFGTTEAAAPPDATVPSASYAYPADGSIVRISSTTASANATSSGGAVTGMATAELNGIQLFGGEISIGQVVASAMAAATAVQASSNTGDTTVTGATYLGVPISVSANGRVQLGDWGYIQTLVATLSAGDPGTEGQHQSMQVLDLHVDADHGGLPAGSEIVIGRAVVWAQADSETTTVTIPKQGPQPGTTTTNTNTSTRTTTTHSHEQNPNSNNRKVNQIPTGLQPKLTRKGHVFPVYGWASFSDSFGSPRADTGWHHGIDIFAPTGTPVLAVAKGTVFSVGWNNLGGNRLWLRDTDGNEFYYAHLSAYSPLAVNGLKVEAGAVLGFVGNTGDAITTPPHLHFEAHPAALLSLGYDGSARDPYTWLVGLEHLRDVKFPLGTASWAKQIAAGVSTQQPGAVLLQSTDISALPRLDNRSLATVLSSSSSGKTTLARD